MVFELSLERGGRVVLDGGIWWDGDGMGLGVLLQAGLGREGGLADWREHSMREGGVRVCGGREGGSG